MSTPDHVDVSGSHMEDTGIDPVNRLSTAISRLGLRPTDDFFIERFSDEAKTNTQAALKRAAFLLQQATKYQKVDSVVLGTANPLRLADETQYLVIHCVREPGSQKHFDWRRPAERERGSEQYLVVARTQLQDTPVMDGQVQRRTKQGQPMWYSNWDCWAVGVSHDLDEVRTIFVEAQSAIRDMESTADALFGSEDEDDVTETDGVQAAVDEAFS